EGGDGWGGMEGKGDGAGEERLLDLFGEEALAAGVGERPAADPVAGGVNRLERDRVGGKRVRGGEALAHELRLRERERAAARTDDEREGWRRLCRLHAMTSRCYGGRKRGNTVARRE